MAKFCFNCGTQLPDGTAFCTNCGTQLPDAPAPAPQPQSVQQPEWQPAPQAAPQYPQQQYYQQPQGYYPPQSAPAKKSKKWLWAIVALLVIGAVIAVLFITGVFGGGSNIDGTWKSEDGLTIVFDGDKMINATGEELGFRLEGNKIILINGNRTQEYLYSLEGDTLTFYEYYDEDMTDPVFILHRKTEGGSEETSGEPSSSEPEPSSSEPEPEPDPVPVPDFEELGITPHLMQPGITRAYVTGDRNDENATAVGTLCVDSYVKGAISDEARAFLQDLGVDLTVYTSRKATFTMSFPSGVTPGIFYEFEDYYDITTYDDYDYAALDEDRYWYEARVTVDGVEKSIYICNVTGLGESEAYMGTIDVEVIVPDGYDGFCYAFIDSRIDEVDVQSEYFDYYEADNILFFRFD